MSNSTTTDRIHDYYKDHHVFVTGANGMVGTAYIPRLVLDTAVSRVYALVRGGEERLWKLWGEFLPSETVQALRTCQKIIVWDGDITLPDCGLGAEQVRTLHEKVTIVVHGASTINLRRPIKDVAPQIIQPSMAIAKLALGCANLSRFVYISTIFASTFVRTREDGIVEGGDALIPEGTVSLDGNVSLDEELAQLLERGTTDSYELVNFPFPYSYCKHITERLIVRYFKEEHAEEKLLILKPSSIGPAESKPFPFYEIPGSSPITTAAVALITSPPTALRFSCHLPSPSMAAYDEVPIDVVVNTLVAHVAFESSGYVNAVCGITGTDSSEDLIEAAFSLRKDWWGRPSVVWSKEDWGSRNLCEIARLLKFWGCRFDFSRGNSVALWNRMNALEKSNWPLEKQKNMSVKEYITGRRKAIGHLTGQMVSRLYKMPSSQVDFFYNSKL